jgi:hypothetical protein
MKKGNALIFAALLLRCYQRQRDPGAADPLQIKKGRCEQRPLELLLFDLAL